MAQILVYYAHPGNRHSQVNRAMAKAARALEGVEFVDLYASYPRHDIDIDREQARLMDYDVIVFQFPLFWYATPSLIKEWIDLVLEHGFAYGPGGNRLAGKKMMLAISAAGPADAYQPNGHHRHTITTFLSPLEQTAVLCNMRYLPPFVLHGALEAQKTDRLAGHVEGYCKLLEALRDGRYDLDAVDPETPVFYDNLPIRQLGK